MHIQSNLFHYYSHQTFTSIHFTYLRMSLSSSDMAGVSMPVVVVEVVVAAAAAALIINTTHNAARTHT